MSNTSLLEQALKDLVAADGYETVIQERSDGRLRIEIVAGPDVCADCLVPKSVLKAVLLGRLPAGAVLDEQDIVYPSDAAPH